MKRPKLRKKSRKVRGFTIDEVLRFIEALMKEDSPYKNQMVKGDLSLHSLLHTYATRSIESGMQVKVLQKLLGHTDISVTLDTYSEVFDSFQTEDILRADKYMKEKGFGIYLTA